LLNRLTSITQTGNGVVDKRVDMNYDRASKLTGITRYRDLAGSQLVASSNYIYDKAGRLTNLNHNQGAASIANYSWTYDGANRITSYTSPDGTSNYTYDNRDQLLNANHTYQGNENYSYDANGNRTNTGYVTGANNRLLSDGTYTYEYDGEGNLTKRISANEITEYTWDYRNRLTQVVVKNSAGQIIKSVEYTYDVFDRRLAKSVDPDGIGAQPIVIERFVYDGDHIVLVFDGAGNLTHRYLHYAAVGSPVLLRRGGKQGSTFKCL
jgi:YD repeat-containing protein